MADGRHRPNTYAEVIRTALERYPSRTAFVHESRTMTYAGAAAFLGRTMRVFAAHGFGPGRGVAVLSTNRPEAWLASGAGVMLGGRYTALHPLGGGLALTGCSVNTPRPGRHSGCLVSTSPRFVDTSSARGCSPATTR